MHSVGIGAVAETMGAADTSALRRRPSARLPQVRPVRAARWTPAHALMLAAGLLGALLTLHLVRRADDRVAVLAADRDLAAGATVEASDLRTVQVAADADVASQLIAPQHLDELVGRTVVGGLHAGQLIGPGALDDPDDRARVMTFAVPAPRAVGGDLTAGDHVDVLAADADGRVGHVLVDATILAVDRGGDGGLGDTNDDVALTVAVGPRGAIRLAGAMRVAEVSVVRATDAVPLRRVRWFVPSAEAAPVRELAGAPDA